MESGLHISVLGIDTPHRTDYVIDRPHGFNHYLLMCFSTRFFTRTATGMEHGEPGDCMLLDPSFPVYHGTLPGAEDGFRNCWIMMTGSRIPQWIEQYDIPCNTLIRTGDSQLLVPVLRSIQAELVFPKPFGNERLRLLAEELFLTVGRHSRMTRELKTYTPTEQLMKQRFVDAKISIHQRFQEPWTVKKMAALVNLSPDRFWVLYQQFFKTSPKDDLIGKRLEEAKTRLLNSGDSMEQIALECGFSSPHYFSRLFKKRTGSSPSRYRQS
ncbi:MAG: hypothetical protein K0Q59_1149 [Paenibacillus sp.]|jgi:AraC-like DNA-binding protein|nr:hypothetical protein [Paenibacillus sp.]